MSMTVVSAEQLEVLQGMFPDETPDSLRRALHRHKGDVNTTIEALLVATDKEKNKKKENDNKGADTKATAWTCGTCTFENTMASLRCSMCDSAAPAGTLPPVAPPKGGEDTAMVVPPWWNAFWSEHRSSLNCDERAAKEILFAGGRFKNSHILTVDIKAKVYRLLGAEEVHHVAPPDDNHDNRYPVGFPRPPRHIMPLGGFMPYPPAPSGGSPYYYPPPTHHGHGIGPRSPHAMG